MKNFLSLITCVLFTTLNVYAQSQDSNEVPDYVLPSPQAYQITKYGDIPVNETAGKISPSVPLYNYRAGALNLPISLSYSGNGVRVSDLPTWTGNNWTLNAGGVITRVVKDLPDETSMPRVFYDEDDLNELIFWQTIHASCEEGHFLNIDGWLNGQDCDPDNPPIIPLLTGYYIAADTRELVTRPDNYDTEADVFNFSFGGYSGSFVLDVEITGYDSNGRAIKEVNPIIIKNEHNLKIELIGEEEFHYGDHHFEFTITTAKGVKYFFGGFSDITQSGTGNSIYAIEETQFVDRSGGQHTYGKRAKTSFYLTKIENHLGDKINLSYHTKPQYEVLSMKNQTLTTSVNLPGMYPCSTSSGGTGISSIKKVKNIVYNGKFLKRIWSSSNPEILFNSTEVTTQNQHYRVLNNMDFGIKKVDLTYWPNESEIVTSQNIERFFIEKVLFTDITGNNRLNSYTFEYDDLNAVPSINSFAQDYLGYYNGVNDNTNLLPKEHKKFVKTHLPYIHPYIEDRIRFNSSVDILADRDPYFEFATKGILKRIYHPTGGFTEIDYEPVEKKIETKGKYLKIYSNMGQANPGWVPNNNYAASAYIGSYGMVTQSGEPEPSVFQTQEVNFNLVINTLDSSGLDYHDYVYLEVKNMNTNEVITEKFPFPTSVMTQQVNTEGQTSFPFTSNDYTLEEGDSYAFKISFGCENGIVTEQNQDPYFSDTPMFVNCTMSYISGYDENDGLGIRVKRVKDYTDENTLANTKRYYYKQMKNINLDEEDTSQVGVYAPFFLTFNSSVTDCENNGFNYGQVNHFATLNSNSGALNFPGSDAISFYKSVTISYGGDNFENGGVEKQFRTVANELPRDFKPQITPVAVNRYVLEQSFKVNNANKTNYGLNNGTLEKESVFKKENNLLYKIKESENKYGYKIRDTIKNMAGSLMENGVTFDLQHSFYDLHFGLYSTYTYTPLLNQSKTTSFIEPIPLSAYITPVLQQGWMTQDEDGDGVTNYNDPDFLDVELYNTLVLDNTLEEYLETKYRHVSSSTFFTYNFEESNLPLTSATVKSNGESVKSYNTYPIESQINNITSISANEAQEYHNLKDQNRIASPVQVTAVIIDESNIEKPLSTSRSIYETGSDGLLLMKKAQTVKGSNLANLEDRIEYFLYDDYGNPREIKKTNGSSVLYFWTSRRTPKIKIVNCTYAEYVSAIGSIEISEDPTQSEMTTLSDLLPNAQILKYDYIPNTDYIEKITDPRGRTMTYHYDEFYRLIHVKDQDNNILSENEYKYHNQN